MIEAASLKKLRSKNGLAWENMKNRDWNTKLRTKIFLNYES